MSKKPRVMKWAVPVAAAAIVAGAIGAGPVIAAVQGAPALPDRSAEQLLADVAQKWSTGKMTPMSGTIVETASLGLPELPEGMGGGADSPLALLSGSHSAKVWYGDTGQVRLMLPGDNMSENDLIVNGEQAWWWDSSANTATRIKIPAHKDSSSPIPSSAASAITPENAARQALKAAEGNTTISVGNDATVAGRASYEVVLTPKTPDSLVKDVRLALDGETLVPLRVQVYAKGAAEPAFEVGFESITFSKPAPENFTFTPPAGAKVKDGTFPEAFGRGDTDKFALGHADPSADGIADPSHPADPAGIFGKDGKDGKDGHPGVVGTGWSSVVVVPFSGKDLGLPGRQSPEATAPEAKAPEAKPSGMPGLADGLMKTFTPVSGTWGSGRLIKTKLVSVLITDDGRLIAGAVTPEALYRAAGQK